jgi:hypothetical protein
MNALSNPAPLEYKMNTIAIKGARRQRHRLIRVLTCALALAIVAPSPAAPQAGTQAVGGGAAQDLRALRDRGDLKLKVVSKTNEDRILFDAASRFKITLTTKTVAEGATIKGLLYDAGILPNADAYRVLYELNPSLRHVSKVAVGNEIVLPIIETGENIGRTSGSLFKLETFDESREALSESAPAMSEAFEELIAHAVAAAPDEDRKARMTTALASYAAGTQAIAKSAASQSTLIFVRGLVQAIGELLQAFKDGKQALPGDADRVLGMAEGVNTIADCSRSNANCDLPVRVTTRKGTSDVPSLRVMYASAYRADQAACTRQTHCVEEFRIGTSPALHELPPAKYTIWAINATGKVVSDRRDIDVKFRGINEFTLAIP